MEDGLEDLEAIVLCPGHVRGRLGEARQEQVVKVSVQAKGPGHEYGGWAYVVVNDAGLVKLRHGPQQGAEHSASELDRGHLADLIQGADIFPVAREQEYLVGRVMEGLLAHKRRL